MSLNSQSILKIHQNNLLSFKGQDANMVVLSELYTCEKVDNNAKLSVKTVLDGVEGYQINNCPYRLSQNEFLLVNEGDDLRISFDAKKKAVGVCFYVDKKYIDQAINLYNISQDWGFENVDYSKSETFLTSTKYSFKQSSFGNHLEKISKLIQAKDISVLTEDFFLDFAKRLVEHQKGVLNHVNSLHSTKLSTRKELYKRVANCKEFIEDNVCSQNLTINHLAKICALSEVQLHRCFKQIYGLTPHQYLIKKKLEIAKELLVSGNHSISEIALLTGFADLPSFSKCFKTHFGLSPFQFIRKN